MSMLKTFTSYLNSSTFLAKNSATKRRATLGQIFNVMFEECGDGVGLAVAQGGYCSACLNSEAQSHPPHSPGAAAPSQPDLS